MKKNSKYIKNLTSKDLQSSIVRIGHPKYRAGQIYHQIYVQRAEDFSNMLTIPKALRDELDKMFVINSIKQYRTQKSKDGTVKFLFRLSDGKSIESVLIPETRVLKDKTIKKRITLCVSSQVGCAVNCEFCATGKIGFQRNLETAEIIDQILMVEKIEKIKISNLVFMGMGEPLHNFEAVNESLKIITDPASKLLGSKRITISTVGVIDNIKLLADFKPSVKLAVSLHATTDDIRKKLIPFKKISSIKDISIAVEYYYQKTKQPITFEYVYLSGINDSKDDAKRLAKICSRTPSKVNIIPYHDISFALESAMKINLKTGRTEDIEMFCSELRKYNVNVFTRSSSGVDIDAACGQLAFSSRNS